MTFADTCQVFILIHTVRALGKSTVVIPGAGALAEGDAVGISWKRLRENIMRLGPLCPSQSDWIYIETVRTETLKPRREFRRRL